MKFYESRSVPGYETEGKPVEHDETAPTRQLAKQAVETRLKSKATGYDVIVNYHATFENVPTGVMCRGSGIAVKRSKQKK